VDLLARDATAADYDVFRALFPELGAREPVPAREHFTAHIAPGAFFIVHDGQPRAYGYLRFHGETAHLVHVVVAPGSRQLGLGHALMREAAGRARRAGCNRWYLNVRKGNVAAITLYERSALRVTFESVLFEIAWADTARLPVGSAVASEVEPTHDRAIEEAFALPQGQLTILRTTPGRLLRAVFESTGPVAFTAFDPGLAQTVSFRVKHPAHARALFESIRSHALPGHASVCVYAEGDAALADALLAAGGTERLRTLRMAGEIEG
jgi:ribosomal protein S18 acetylase RimI-like enzyme